MSLPSFLACLYFIFTVILWVKKKSFGKMFILYGGLTLTYVIAYPSILSVSYNIQNIMIFLVFSLMILNFGLTFGIIMKLLKKSDKTSSIAAVIGSLFLIVLLFNVRTYFTYLYIPVLLYKLCDVVNKKWVVLPMKN